MSCAYMGGVKAFVSNASLGKDQRQTLHYADMGGLKALVSNVSLGKRTLNYADMGILGNGASFVGRKYAFIRSGVPVVENAEERAYVNIIV